MTLRELAREFDDSAATTIFCFLSHSRLSHWPTRQVGTGAVPRVSAAVAKRRHEVGK
jgi:hypothetical protein